MNRVACSGRSPAVLIGAAPAHTECLQLSETDMEGAQRQRKARRPGQRLGDLQRRTGRIRPSELPPPRTRLEAAGTAARGLGSSPRRDRDLVRCAKASECFLCPFNVLLRSFSRVWLARRRNSHQ